MLARALGFHLFPVIRQRSVEGLHRLLVLLDILDNGEKVLDRKGRSRPGFARTGEEM
jgi:hypothetical protein